MSSAVDHNGPDCSNSMSSAVAHNGPDCFNSMSSAVVPNGPNSPTTFTSSTLSTTIICSSTKVSDKFIGETLFSDDDQG